MAKSSLVLSVQNFLRGKGFPPGTIDGVDGQATLTAWRAYLDSLNVAGGAGHTVLVDPPLSATVEATMFGLDWDGSPDEADNGEGFFGYDTTDKTLAGCSLPREVMLSTFGISDDWKTCGISEAWKAHENSLLNWVKLNKPTLMIDSGGRSVSTVPLVDAGPTAGTDNGIDLTYATAHALQTYGKALATYSIILNGQPMTIKGWNFSAGKVG